MMKRNTTIILTLFAILSILPEESRAQQNKLEIQEIVNMICVDSIEVNIINLQNFQTRFLLNENRLEIANYLKNKLIEYGYDNVIIDTFECQINHASGLDTLVKQYNVRAFLSGPLSNEEIILYGAHYDSFSTDTNPLEIAPGADDNASGTAAVLETARVLRNSGNDLLHTVEFILFAAEEYMNSANSGSEYRAYQAVTNNEEIVFMINNDMVSYNDGNNTICFSDYPSCRLARNMAISACVNYSSLNYQLWPSDWPPFADVEPFFDLGAQVVYIEESFFNPFYHTSNDIIDNIDFIYCTEVAKISCAAILKYDVLSDVNKIIEDNEFEVFPNPCIDEIHIKTNNLQPVESIKIWNLHGQILYSDISPKNLTIQVSDLESGIYICEIKSRDNKYYYHFIKTNR